MPAFTYQPSQWVPFRDVKAIERCRRIKRKDVAKHRSKDLKIQVVPDDELVFIWFTDIISRIMRAREERRKCVMILPNPWPGYRHVARMINALKLDCSHVHAFAMDEYADQDGRIAPPDWENGFTHAMTKFFYDELDAKLRPPKWNWVGFTNRNIGDYGKMIADLGGADICYSGPGWTGHLAFIEPDAPEFDAPLKEWMKMSARVCTLSPFTLAQNSLHGCFGLSGDLAAVPPKAATIGPAEVIAAKNRFDFHAITVQGTHASWQRMISRLCLHGPVTPRLPTSVHQLLRTDVYVSESIAADIEPTWSKGY
ncbi:MAG: hypothetical protein NTW19_04015 [Planctomycetota bacterium]|nr:hypothetical protein [Planctomycetota bacterium]